MTIKIILDEDFIEKNLGEKLQKTLYDDIVKELLKFIKTKSFRNELHKMFLELLKDIDFLEEYDELSDALLTRVKKDLISKFKKIK
uniref:Uncharacterized protein n=1 Tax=viral metagenome TaxID=1070528 RepID=A0A6M3IEP4_9ZZZZ